MMTIHQASRRAVLVLDRVPLQQDGILWRINSSIACTCASSAACSCAICARAPSAAASASCSACCARCSRAATSACMHTPHIAIVALEENRICPCHILWRRSMPAKDGSVPLHWAAAVPNISTPSAVHTLGCWEEVSQQRDKRGRTYEPHDVKCTEPAPAALRLPPRSAPRLQRAPSTLPAPKQQLRAHPPGAPPARLRPRLPVPGLQRHACAPRHVHAPARPAFMCTARVQDATQ